MINKIRFTGELTRIGDTDFWTDGTEHDIEMWNGDREKLKLFGHFVIRLTAPNQLGERLGPHINVEAVGKFLTFSKDFEEQS